MAYIYLAMCKHKESLSYLIDRLWLFSLSYPIILHIPNKHNACIRHTYGSICLLKVTSVTVVAPQCTVIEVSPAAFICIARLVDRIGKNLRQLVTPVDCQKN